MRTASAQGRPVALLEDGAEQPEAAIAVGPPPYPPEGRGQAGDPGGDFVLGPDPFRPVPGLVEKPLGGEMGNAGGMIQEHAQGRGAGVGDGGAPTGRQQAQDGLVELQAALLHQLQRRHRGEGLGEAADAEGMVGRPSAPCVRGRPWAGRPGPLAPGAADPERDPGQAGITRHRPVEDALEGSGQAQVHGLGALHGGRDRLSRRGLECRPAGWEPRARTRAVRRGSWSMRIPSGDGESIGASPRPGR